LAIKYLDAKRIRALSSDTLPTNVPDNTIAELTDTYMYKWFDGTDWNPIFGRGCFCSGSHSSTIDYIVIQTLGNATDFGDTTTDGSSMGGEFWAGCSGVTRCLTAGGARSGNSMYNNIEYFSPSTLGNTVDYGDLTVARQKHGGTSDKSRGVFHGGSVMGTQNNTIDYVTIDTLGNATDFGDTGGGATGAPGSVSNLTRACYGGGASDGGYSAIIWYLTIQTTGNSADFGDLTQSREFVAGGDNDTGGRGCFGGGYNNSRFNTIDYITIASTGNATDFGDLTSGRLGPIGVSDDTRVCWGGGDVSGSSNIIDYNTIASTGNATDFGDLTVARKYGAGVQT